MEDAERVLLARSVVAEHEVELVVVAPAPGDGGDRVVGGAVRLGEHAHELVGVPAPRREDPVGELDDALLIGAAKADDGHRPLDDPRGDVGESREGELPPNARARHGKGVAPALVVLVREDGAAHDGQVGVRADRVVREHPHELEQPLEGHAVDPHGHVLLGEDDAVLVVVHVGRVLHEPPLPRQLQGDEANGLTGGIVETPGVALALTAEQAARIGVRLPVEGGGYRARVLLGLREVDRDVEVTVAGVRHPLAVAGDAIGADVVGVERELVEVVGRLLGTVLVELPERRDDLPGSRGDAAHEARVKEVAARDAVLDDAATDRVVQEERERLLERGLRRLPLLDVEQGVGLVPQDVKEEVRGVGLLLP